MKTLKVILSLLFVIGGIIIVALTKEAEQPKLFYSGIVLIVAGAVLLMWFTSADGVKSKKDKKKEDENPSSQEADSLTEFVSWALIILLLGIPSTLTVVGLCFIEMNAWIKIAVGIIFIGTFCAAFYRFCLKRVKSNQVATDFLFGGRPNKTSVGSEKSPRFEFKPFIELEINNIEEAHHPVTIQDVPTSNKETAEYLGATKEEREAEKKFFEADVLNQSTECTLTVAIMYGLDPNNHRVYKAKLNSLKDAQEILGPKCEALARSIASTVTTVMLQHKKYRAHVEEQIAEGLRAFMKDWGIKIYGVALIVNPSGEIVEAINKLSLLKVEAKQALEEKAITVTEAEGQAKKIELINDAQTKATKDRIKVYTDLAETAGGKLLIEKIVDAVKNNTKIFADKDSLSFLSTLAAIPELTNTSKKERSKA